MKKESSGLERAGGVWPLKKRPEARSQRPADQKPSKLAKPEDQKRKSLHKTNVLIKVTTNKEMVRSTILLFFITFIKTCSWKALTTHQVKGHIYLDK